MMADKLAMFHQVKVTESHNDFLRFSWWPQENVDNALTEFRMNFHLFPQMWQIGHPGLERPHRYLSGGILTQTKTLLMTALEG